MSIINYDVGVECGCKRIHCITKTSGISNTIICECGREIELHVIASINCPMWYNIIKWDEEVYNLIGKRVKFMNWFQEFEAVVTKVSSDRYIDRDGKIQNYFVIKFDNGKTQNYWNFMPNSRSTCMYLLS